MEHAGNEHTPPSDPPPQPWQLMGLDNPLDCASSPSSPSAILFSPVPKHFPSDLISNSSLNLSNHPLSVYHILLLVHYLLTHPSSVLSLSLWNCSLADDALKYLSDLIRFDTYLEDLELDVNSFTEGGALLLASSLQHNRSLRSLGLYNNPLIGDFALSKVINALALGDCLRDLRLGLNASPLGVHSIASLLNYASLSRSLRSLTLRKINCSRVLAEELVRGLAACEGLEELSFIHSEMGVGIFEGVVTLLREKRGAQMKKVDLTGAISRFSSSFLPSHPLTAIQCFDALSLSSLRHLDLSNNSLGPDSLSLLFTHGLRGNSTLKYLHLNNNYQQNEGLFHTIVGGWERGESAMGLERLGLAYIYFNEQPKRRGSNNSANEEPAAEGENLVKVVSEEKEGSGEEQGRGRRWRDIDFIYGLMEAKKDLLWIGIESGCTRWTKEEYEGIQQLIKRRQRSYQQALCEAIEDEWAGDYTVREVTMIIVEYL